MSITIYRRPGLIGRIGLFLLVAAALLLLTGCGWADTASALVTALIPATSAVLGLAAAFGAKISPQLYTAIQTWGNELVADLQNVVKPLIKEWDDAPDDQKDSILDKLNLAITVALDRFDGVLTALHVFSDAWHIKLAMVIQSVRGALLAILNLVPIVKGDKATLDKRLLAYHASGGEVPNAGDFKRHFKAILLYRTGHGDLDAATKAIADQGL